MCFKIRTSISRIPVDVGSKLDIKYIFLKEAWGWSEDQTGEIIITSYPLITVMLKVSDNVGPISEGLHSGNEEIKIGKQRIKNACPEITKESF